MTGKESLFCWLERGGSWTDGGSEQLSYTITDMGEEGEHSIRDWRDSAKYLDTTLPLKKGFGRGNFFFKMQIFIQRLSNYFQTLCSFVCFCNLVGGEQ